MQTNLSQAAFYAFSQLAGLGELVVHVKVAGMVNFWVTLSRGEAASVCDAIAKRNEEHGDDFPAVEYIAKHNQLWIGK